MLTRAAVWSFVLLACASRASAQGVYTTAIGITQQSVVPNIFQLDFYFEPVLQFKDTAIIFT